MDKSSSQPGSPGGRAMVSRDALISFCLVVITLAVYCQVVGFDFCNYDDPFLVYQNPVVKVGLTWGGVIWALKTSYFDFWHPVTWWSHMLDCELFGLSAGWHHLVNVAFHAANTVLLFRVLQRMTGAWKRSALVAALFALHPLHVESVAWVAERKDVLSTFFFLLALWAYVRYVAEVGTQKSRADHFNLLILLFFGLGLATKPMLVTFPCVLLLLDFWPLNRIANFQSGDGTGSRAVNRSEPLGRLIGEKLPFFGLTLVSCIITYLGMKSGEHLLSAQKVAWGFRLSNAAVSYVQYLGKMIWPESLTVCYPDPGHWELWQWLGATVVLLLITGLSLSRWHKQPYLIFGWLWFLGTLVPVIGIVAMSDQSLADRYMYIPSIGVLVAVVWGVADAARQWKLAPSLISGAAAAVLLILGVLSWIQVGYWRNSITLWSHCLAVNPVNDVAQYNLGYALHGAGRFEEAMKHYQEAVRINPDGFGANLNLGALLALKGDSQAATNYFARAIKINPHYPEAHEYMGIALLQLGDYTGAVRECTNVSLLETKNGKALVGVANALSEVGRSNDAISYYSQALQLNPAYAEACHGLGLEWLKRGMAEDAVFSLRRACELTSNAQPAYLADLAEAYARAGEITNAVASAQKACARAAALGETNLLKRNQELLERYRSRESQ